MAKVNSLKNKREVIDKACSDFRELVEKYADEHDKLCCVVASTKNIVLVRIGEDDVPTPDFDSPLVNKLYKEIEEKDKVLEYWIRECKNLGLELAKRKKNGSD